jgi:hypothetical protein
MNETFQVLLQRDSVGFITTCEAKGYKGKHHQRKSWALEEAHGLFPASKLVELGKDPVTKAVVYLVVWLPHADLVHASIESRPAGTKLELTAQAEAGIERQIAAHGKLLNLAAVGFSRSVSLVRAYALIAGAHANAIMEIAPHGTGEKRIEQEIPGVSKQRLHNWRKFAEKIKPELAKSQTVLLLSAPSLGKKSIPAKVVAALDKACKEVMGDVGIMAYLDDKEKKAAGGFRPDAQMVEAWLRANHLDLAGKSYDELPPEIQAAFRAQYVHPTPSAEEIAEMERETWREHLQWLDAALTEKSYVHLAEDMVEFEKLQNILCAANQRFLDLIQKAKTNTSPRPSPRKRGEGESLRGVEGTAQP